MSKVKKTDKLPDLLVEMVHIAVPDAAERIRSAVEIILAAACHGQESGVNTQARANSNLPGDGGSSDKSKDIGL